MDGAGVDPVADGVGGGARSRGHHLVLAVGIGAAGLLVGLVAGALVAVAGGVGLLAGGASPGAGSGGVDAVVVASLAATEVGYGATAVVYLLRRTSGVRATLGWPSPAALASGVVAALALVAAGQALLTLVPGVGVDELVAGTGGPVSPALLLGLAVVSVVFVGPAEELLFRGAVYGTLRRGFGPAGANLLSSGLFVVAHAGSIGAGLVGLVPLVIVLVGSLSFGYAYERTGTLLVPVAMHAVYDAALFALAYVLLT